MNHRFRTHQDQRAPASASDQPLMSVDTPSSASIAQPTKEVGRNSALSASLSSTSSIAQSAPHPTPGAGNRTKRHRDEESADVGSDEKDMRSPSVVASSSPTSPVSPSMNVDRAAQPVPGTPPAPIALNPLPSTDAPRTPADLQAPFVRAANIPVAKMFVPVTARRDTLLTRANIDCRKDDSLLVSVRVHAGYPGGAPTIARHQYQAVDEVKRKCAVNFIGSTTGLNITCPTIPRYLLQSGDRLVAAVDALTSEQRAWHDALVTQTTRDFDVVRGEGADNECRADACEWLWTHLLKAVPQPSLSRNAVAPLWFQRAEITESWAELLAAPGTRILRDTRPAMTPAVTFHSYQLLLCGANSVLTHILACQLVSYGLLRSVDAQTTREWEALLRSDSACRGNTNGRSTASTDSSSSDSDDGWTHSTLSRKVSHQRTRLARSLPKRAATFGSERMVGSLANRCLADTGTPVLALSSSVRVRAWEDRYTSCLVDNFQSLGCDVADLVKCPVFLKLSTAIPKLSQPTAAWCVNQHNGGADVTIFVREADKDELPKINAQLQPLFPELTPQLRIKCSLQEANSRGRAVRNAPLRSVYLNEHVPVVTARPSMLLRKQSAAAAVVSTAPSAPLPPAGSWASAVLCGVKRLSVVSTLDHRPKKKQSASERAAVSGAAFNLTGAQAPGPLPDSATPAHHDVAMEQSAAWQSLLLRNTEMEKRLTEMSAVSASVQEVLTRNLEKITTQLFDQQRIVTNQLDKISTRLAQQSNINVALQSAMQVILDRLAIVTPVQPMGLVHTSGPSHLQALSDDAEMTPAVAAAAISRPAARSSMGRDSSPHAPSASASPALNGQGIIHG